MAVSAEDVATPVNSYKPYQAYLYYGNYPLARSIYALLNDPRSGLPWGFTSFMTSDKGQRSTNVFSWNVYSSWVALRTVV